MDDWLNQLNEWLVKWEKSEPPDVGSYHITKRLVVPPEFKWIQVDLSKFK
jgi:hypothetical protein